MSNTNTGGPAFPESGPRGQASGGEGMTMRQYAATKLRVADSGDDWLDSMIRKSQRQQFASKAMQQLIGSDWPTAKSEQNQLALLAFSIADSMIEMEKKA